MIMGNLSVASHVCGVLNGLNGPSVQTADPVSHLAQV